MFPRPVSRPESPVSPISSSASSKPLNDAVASGFENSVAQQKNVTSLTESLPLALQLGNYQSNKGYLETKLVQANTTSGRITNTAGAMLKRDAVNFISHPKTISAAYLLLSTGAHYFYQNYRGNNRSAGNMQTNVVSRLLADRNNAGKLFTLVEQIASIYALNYSGAVDYVSSFLNRSLISALDSEGAGTQMQALSNVFHDFSKDAAPLLKDMPPERVSAFKHEQGILKAGIESSLNDGRRAISYLQALDSFNRLVAMLSLPVNRNNHRGLENPETASTAIERWDDTATFLSEYDIDTVKKPFLRFVSALNHYSINAEKMGVPMLYLEGLPATAKTFLVNEVIADQHGYHIIKTNLDDFLDYITGSQNFRNERDLVDASNPILSEAIKKASEKNVVFFLDEVDFSKSKYGARGIDIINAWWSETQGGKRADGELSAEFGVRSGVSGGVIFASNVAPDNPAFKSRVEYAKVVPPPPEKQRKILADKASKAPQSLSPLISATTKNKVAEELGKHVDFLFEQSQKYDYQYFNVRHSERILEDIARHIADQVDMGRPINGDEIRDDILSQISLILASNGQNPISDDVSDNTSYSNPSGFSLLRENEFYTRPETEEDKRQAIINAIKQRWPEANLDNHSQDA